MFLVWLIFSQVRKVNSHGWCQEQGKRVLFLFYSYFARKWRGNLYYCLNLDRSRIHPIKNSYVQGIEHEMRSRFKNKWIARCSWTWWVLFFKIIFFYINIYLYLKKLILFEHSSKPILWIMKCMNSSINYTSFKSRHSTYFNALMNLGGME